jgi:hypothetical protein
LSVFYKQRFAPTSNDLIPSTPYKPPNKSKVLSGAGNGKGILVQMVIARLLLYHRIDTMLLLKRNGGIRRKQEGSGIRLISLSINWTRREIA